MIDFEPKASLKKTGFSRSNPHKIAVIRTSIIEMLQSYFGHMTISARQLETNDKILSVISWLENVTLYSFFKDIFVKIQNLKCL